MPGDAESFAERMLHPGEASCDDICGHVSEGETEEDEDPDVSYGPSPSCTALAQEH